MTLIQVLEDWLKTWTKDWYVLTDSLGGFIMSDNHRLLYTIDEDFVNVSKTSVLYAADPKFFEKLRRLLEDVYPPPWSPQRRNIK